MTITQLEKAKHFKALHEGPRPFVIANVWDKALARLIYLR